MQLVMWVILACTVAIAAVVGRSANRANRVELAATPISVREVSVRMPAKWRVRPTGGEDGRVIAQATEPETERGPGRTLQVLVDRIDTPMSPLEYLAENFSAALPGEADAEDMSYSMLSSVTIAGQPGSIITLQHAQPDPRARGAVAMLLHKDVYACVVLPSLQAITVHLSGQYMPADATDQELVHQIAGAITMSSQAKFEPDGAVITLSPGIQISPPAQLSTVVQTDPNRTDRVLWRRIDASTGASAQKFNQAWTAVELVGCLFPILDTSDPKRSERATSALETLLLTRDGRWREAAVSEEGGGWKAVAANAVNGEKVFPATAYLLPDASGRALLAIFHGGFGGKGFAAMWAELAGATKFLPASEIAQLEDAGAAEAARIAREDWKKIFADRNEQWWLWTDQSDRPHVGWQNLRWSPGKLAADVDLRERHLDGEVARINGHWEMRDGRSYTSDLTMTQSRVGRIATIQQKTTLAKGQLAFALKHAGTSPVKEWKLAAPTQFIPGELLRLAMGQLAPGPMLLKTDSFVDCPFIAAPEPLTVTIRPGPVTQRKADGDEQPMRCVMAEVNGSGRVSRWYFDSAGELQSIDLPQGLQAQPSNDNTIRFDFGKDGQMAP